MCTVGSVASYFTRQAVLGGFSLFLCVAIGIRFLVKPDSKERPEKGGEAKLTAKEIAVSLFFGLTIGFGTGFFGSGGGMMMLIVFTTMLGYDRRTAVGTSLRRLSRYFGEASERNIYTFPSALSWRGDPGMPPRL